MTGAFFKLFFVLSCQQLEVLYSLNNSFPMRTIKYLPIGLPVLQFVSGFFLPECGQFCSQAGLGGYLELCTAVFSVLMLRLGWTEVVRGRCAVTDATALIEVSDLFFGVLYCIRRG